VIGAAHRRSSDTATSGSVLRCAHVVLPTWWPEAVRVSVKTDLGPQQLRVLRLLKSGLTQYATGQTLGISRQRVHRIVERLRELGELPEERAS
jgi:predicted DNA-binding protein (UPF0251 family)